MRSPTHNQPSETGVLDSPESVAGDSHQRMVSRHIVALSGGKDSTAMALRLGEVEPRRYEYVCTPTGIELPEMNDHWKRLEDILQSPIIKLPSMSFGELIEANRMLPNFRARFCTHILKIVPFEKYLIEALPVIAYVGLRADEPDREGASYGIELFIKTRHPMREWGWTIKDVLGYLKRRGVHVPTRTDCDRCPLQSLPEWYRLWKDYPERYESACKDEDNLGHTYRSPGRDTWPAGLRDLAERFAAGNVPLAREKRSAGGCRVCSM